MVRKILENELNELLELYLHLHEDSVPAMSEHLRKTWKTIVQDKNHHIIVNVVDGKIGLLSSMFTNPDYRRKGIAKELLSRVVKEAKDYGCGTVQITASDMGVKLYTDFGFVHNQNFMQYKL